jgi:hypothetical protein
MAATVPLVQLAQMAAMEVMVPPGQLVQMAAMEVMVPLDPRVQMAAMEVMVPPGQLAGPALASLVPQVLLVLHQLLQDLLVQLGLQAAAVAVAV